MISSIDYATLDLDPEMDASLKAIVENPESEVKGTSIYLMKIGDRETGSDTFTQWVTTDPPYAQMKPWILSA